MLLRCARLLIEGEVQSVSGEGDASKTAHLYMQGVDICKRKRNRKRYWEAVGEGREGHGAALVLAIRMEHASANDACFCGLCASACDLKKHSVREKNSVICLSSVD